MDFQKPLGIALLFSIGVLALLLGGCLPASPQSGFEQPATTQPENGPPADGGGAGVATVGDAATSVAELGGASADLAPSQAMDLAPAADMAVVCDKVQSTAGLSSPSGHHNAGRDCQGCHTGGDAPKFTVGGTLYTALAGGTAVAGATIHVTDAANKSVQIVTATNGNFWSTVALTYPLKVEASLCPSTLAMNATVGGNGSCNGCHNNAFQVHLP